VAARRSDRSAASFSRKNGQVKPEQQEIIQLGREVAKLKAERDILKKAAAYFAKESI
jgi:transposase